MKVYFYFFAVSPSSLLGLNRFARRLLAYGAGGACLVAKGWFRWIVFLGIVAIVRFLENRFMIISTTTFPPGGTLLFYSSRSFYIPPLFGGLRLLLFRFYRSNRLPWALLLWLKLYSIKYSEGGRVDGSNCHFHWSWFLGLVQAGEEEGNQIIIHFQGALRT